MNLGLRLQVGQVMAEATVEDMNWTPDILDDILTRLGQALASAVMTVQALDIPVGPYSSTGQLGFTPDMDEH